MPTHIKFPSASNASRVDSSSYLRRDSSSAYFKTSSKASELSHSGQANREHRLPASRSERMQDVTQTKHVDGGCWHALVRAEAGKAARANFSKQTAHSCVSMVGERKDQVVSWTAAIGSAVQLTWRTAGRAGQAALEMEHVERAAGVIGDLI